MYGLKSMSIQLLVLQSMANILAQLLSMPATLFGRLPWKLTCWASRTNGGHDELMDVARVLRERLFQEF